MSFNSFNSIAVGDIVVIKDLHLFFHSWPLARVILIQEMMDGSMCVHKGIYRRAIYELVPLLEQAATLSLVGRYLGSSSPQEEVTSHS